MSAYWNLKNNPKQEYKYFPTHQFWRRDNQLTSKTYHRIMRTFYEVIDLDNLDEYEEITHHISWYAKYHMRKHGWSIR